MSEGVGRDLFCIGDLFQQRGAQKWQKKEPKTNPGDVDGRVPEEEELVCTRNNNGPKQADEPSTECRRRYGGIVGVGYRGPDFGIRRFIFESDGRRVKVGVIYEGLRFSQNV